MWALAAACGSPALSQASPNASAESPQASPPPASVQNVRRLHILCLVASGRIDAIAQRDLCARVQRLAGAGAPVPVAVAQLGDPAVLDPAALTLLVHASAERIDGRAVLALSLRSFRNGGPDSVTLFGPVPRAVPAGDGEQIDRALEAALNQVLPWRNPPQGARPID